MNPAAAIADMHHVGVYCLEVMETQGFSREIRKTHLTRFTSRVCASRCPSELPLLTFVSYGSMGECGELHPVQLRWFWDRRQAGRCLAGDWIMTNTPSHSKRLWVHSAEPWLGFQPHGGAPKRIESMYSNRHSKGIFRLLHREARGHIIPSYQHLPQEGMTFSCPMV